MASEIQRLIVFGSLCFLYFYLARVNESPESLEQLEHYLNLKNAEIQALQAATEHTNFTGLGLTNVVKNNFDNNTIPILPLDVSNEVQSLWGNDTAQQGQSYSLRIGSSFVATNAVRDLNFTQQDMPVPPIFKNPGINKNILKERPLSRHTFNVLLQDKLASNDSCHGISIDMDNQAQYNNSALRGIYFERDGSFYASTQSLKFSGYLALPFMIAQSDPFYEYKFPLAKNLSTAMQLATYSGLDNVTLEERFLHESSKASRCEWMIFGQLKPTDLTVIQLQEIEDELANPEGRPIGEVPLMQVQAYAISLDCAEISYFEGSGHRLEVGSQALRTYSTWASVLLLCLVASFIHQVKQYGSASQISKVSFHSMVGQYAMDLVVAVLTPIYINNSNNRPRLVPIVLLAGGLAYTEGRYLIAILLAQYPRTSAPAETQTESTASTPAPLETSTVPLQERAVPRPTTGYTEDSASSLVFTNLGIGSVVVMTVGLMLVVELDISIIRYGLLLTYYSTWLPQIWLNYKQAMECPISLRWALTSSVVRLAPAVYYFYSGNMYMAEHQQPKLCLTLILYVGIQLLMLYFQTTSWWSNLMQERKSCSGYGYHPIILDLVEFTRAPSGLSRGELNELIESHMSEWSNQERHSQWQTQECVICLADIPIVPPISELTSEILETTRQNYAITPCDHCFHSTCLERWLHDRLQCPICRDPLPAT